jgi:hypothetical protein
VHQTNGFMQGRWTAQPHQALPFVHPSSLSSSLSFGTGTGIRSSAMVTHSAGQGTQTAALPPGH